MSDLGTILVPPAGPMEAVMLIVGQSPGSEEEKTGEPFVGPAGELLQAVVASAGIKWYEARRTNVFKYRLYTKDQATIQKMIDHKWRQPLGQEIVGLPNLRVIVSLGNEALYALTSKWGITMFHGRPMMVTAEGVARRMVPTVHPSAILRGRKAWKKWLQADLEKARRIVEREESRGPSPVL